MVAAYPLGVKEEIAAVENEIDLLCERHSFDEARAKLDSWIGSMPQARRDRFPECANRAMQLKESIGPREALCKQKIDVEAARLHSREIKPSGSWVDLALGPDDFKHNWKVDKGDSQDARAGWAEAENRIDLRSWPSRTFSVFRDGYAKWLDY